MYPDVSGPRFELERLDAVVDFLLRSFREQALPRADIGADVPIRICANGWPTAAGRSEERQADVLETVLRAAPARARELNVTHWDCSHSATPTARKTICFITSSGISSAAGIGSAPGYSTSFPPSATGRVPH